MKLERLPPATLPLIQRSLLWVEWLDAVPQMRVRPAPAAQRWRDYVARIESAMQGVQRGQVVSAVGDGVLLAFHQPEAAIHAVGLLHAAAGHGEPGTHAEGGLRLRFGMHQAVMPADKVDAQGPAAAVVVRLTALAGDGELCISEEVRQYLLRSAALQMTSRGVIDGPVNGLPLPIGRRIYGLDVAQCAAFSPCIAHCS